MQVLALDIAGTPFRWMKPTRAASYLANGKVAWSLGAEDAFVLHGGHQRTGCRSQIDVPAVIALARSEGLGKHMGALRLGKQNQLLFKRDRGICAYCGKQGHHMTRDHIVPLGQKGRDIWENVVTACRPCNERKACRTPDQAGMPLLYLPYVPTRAEHFILSGRHILTDQMDYLAARLPIHSRAL